MNIAILHYHLRSGGVGSVVRAQAAALSRCAPDDRVVILSGTPSETDLPVPVKMVPGLDYAARSQSMLHNADDPESAALARRAAAALADEIERALDEAFPGDCDLLHVHNPLIRKNEALLGALAELQRRGLRLLVQVHDLAEDFRPDVYAADSEYPGDCAYAAINTRDREALVASGLDERHVHLLPNPVSIPAGFEPRAGFEAEAERGRRTVLYPVRAIRRKNLGEALLLSRFLPSGAELAVTLPPTSLRDQATYAAWKNLAFRQRLPVRFEAGLAARLADLYSSSFCALTTSVKEGFGYAYLDPLARGIPVVGREIPYVVDDFSAAGIALPKLYRAIRVPRAALPEQALRAALDLRLEAFRRAYAPIFAARGRFGAALARGAEAVGAVSGVFGAAGGSGAEGGSGSEAFEAALAGLVRRFESEYIDFGALDEALQEGLLRDLEGDAAFERALCELNPFLPGLFDARLSREEAEDNRRALAAAYSDEFCAERLLSVYRDALSPAIGGGVDRRTLLLGYLRPESFFMSAS
jgi:glycosyltransferase involved in cell wall biosynthesis